MGKEQLLKAIIWVAFICFVLPANSQFNHNRVLVIDSGHHAYTKGVYDIIEYTDIFIDSTGHWTIDQIISDSFQNRFAPDTQELAHTLFSDFGPDVQYIWVRLLLSTTSEYPENWLLNFSAHEVEGYLVSGDSILQYHRSGLLIPLDQRQYKGLYSPAQPIGIRVMPDDTIKAFLRLKSPRFSYKNALADKYDATIFKPEVFSLENRPFQAWIYFILGIVLATAIYHLIIFYYQRNKVTLYFSLFLLAYLIVYLGYRGSREIPFFEALWEIAMPNLMLMQAAVSLFVYLFSREFLRLKELLPRWDKIWAVNTILLVSHGVVLFALFISAGDWSDANPSIFWPLLVVRMVLLTVEMVFIIALGPLSWYKGNRIAWIYLVAMTPFAFQQMANGLNYMMQPSWLQWVYGETGTIFTVLVFAFGIARQIKDLQEDKIAADKRVASEKASADKFKALDEYKTRFFTNVTHQFRTPLTVILGMADQIREHPTTWVNQGTELIKRNADRLLQLVNQILNLSRLDSGQLKVSFIQGNINNYISYIIESFHSLARDNELTLKFDPEPSEVVMDYDPDKILDIVSNLVSNAIKFTSSGGEVRISTSASDNNIFKLEVKDTGQGIPVELLPQIFQRFYQVEPGMEDKRGSGIGLALVKEFTELLGGHVSVESAIDKGSKFTVSLPMTNNAELAESPAITTDSNKYPQPETIDPQSEKISFGKSEKPVVLVVDDNIDVVSYLTTVLAENYKVIREYNGIDGMKTAFRTTPDLIVSDVMMPQMDGLQMCRQLKKDIRTSHIPIVLLTAKADRGSKLEGLHTGADDYLVKPFNRNELLVRIENLIELRNVLRDKYRDLRFILDDGIKVDGEHSREDDFLKSVKSEVESHISDPDFRIEELCRQIGMSRSQVYRKFKALTNRSIGDLIRKIRLVKARQLLESTDLNVSQVSIEVGFRNLSTFSKAFKAEFGITPRKASKTSA